MLELKVKTNYIRKIAIELNIEIYMQIYIHIWERHAISQTKFNS